MVSPRQHRNRGVALVIVLAIVVLLTALVVAYFSRSITDRQLSNSSLNEATVDHLARSAANIVIADLRQEIVNGSTPVYPSPSPASGTVYVPKTAANMVPQVSGVPTPPPATTPVTWPIPNLIRRSVRADAIASPGVASRASALTSSPDSMTPAAERPPDGRAISRARWNSHYLIPRLNAGSATVNTTPVNTFTPPDWVMVTKEKGPVVLSTPFKDATGTAVTPVGRYAYAIYDEGGLLDMNVAGYPAGLTTDQIGQKGSLALADLTQISLTQTEINNLVGWRDYASAQFPDPDPLSTDPVPGSVGSYGQYVFTAANATAWLKNFVTKNTTGHTKARSLVVGGASARTDQIILSRQQLLALRSSLSFNQDALQYLGTFSRDLEQPSFIPDSGRPRNTKFKRQNGTVRTDAGGNDAYSADGTLQDRINPSLLNVRNGDGTPVMRRRFPLSRLALVQPNPTPDNATKIYNYFGLTWDSTNKRWTYDHGGLPNQIMSLYDPDTSVPCVSRAGREPDFFEILRAVINCDSLGKQHAGLDNNSQTNPGPVMSPHEFQSGSVVTPGAIDGAVNYQIIQIGANLIDQYDADSYPTCIYYNSREFYGVENLPYLAGWELVWYRMKALTAGTDFVTPPTLTPAVSGTTYETSVMLQPILWNPHVADPNPAPTGVPTNFRVIAGAMTDTALTLFPQVMAGWWDGDYTHVKSSYPATATYASANGMTRSGTYYVYPSATLEPDPTITTASILTFSTGPGDAAFREPFRLRAPNYPTGSNASNTSGYAAGRITIGADTTLAAADGGAGAAIGFYCGKCWTGPSVDHTNDAKWLAQGNLNRDSKLKLQYQDAAGKWFTYDVIEQVYNVSGNYSTVDNTDTLPYLRGFRTAVRADPRTDRWGLFQMNTFPSTSQTDVPSGISLFAGNGVDTSSVPLYYLPQGITWKPSQGSTYLTTGNNAGGAPAPGWVGSGGWNVGDTMVNLTGTNGNPNAGPKTSATPGSKTYYSDPDGVVRRSSGGNFSGNAGLPFYTANNASRPIVLNRPFHSVAEMGHAFRGVAWRNLDFFLPESGDAALLDAFCLNELDNAPGDVSVAGRVDLNTRQPKVLAALISAASKSDDVSPVSATEALAAGQALVDWTADTTSQTAGVLNKGPLRNRAELVGKFVSPVAVTPAVILSNNQTPVYEGAKSYQGYSSVLTGGTNAVFATTDDAAIKRRRESVMRALADSGNARTWNLLIDVVAQTGRYPAKATTAADLAKFIIQGETHYWVHVAIDRYTGEVVAKQVEQVTE